MTAQFAVRTTPKFDRLLKKLTRHHPDLVDHFVQALATLAGDPYNTSRQHAIKKLEDVRPGEGQYRLRAGRFRFGTTSPVKKGGSSTAVCVGRTPTVRLRIRMTGRWLGGG
jgi:mRNA-degrading endonuclease RelE of RelBE toxin-antitoxin system